MTKVHIGTAHAWIKLSSQRIQLVCQVIGTSRRLSVLVLSHRGTLVLLLSSTLLLIGVGPIA